MENGERRNGESLFTYELSASESLSEGVIKTVSDVLDSEPAPDASTDVEAGRALEPLYGVVDPEALDRVFRTDAPDDARSRGRVTFSYHGHEVTVRSEGRISVERPESPTSETATE